MLLEQQWTQLSLGFCWRIKTSFWRFDRKKPRIFHVKFLLVYAAIAAWLTLKSADLTLGKNEDIQIGMSVRNIILVITERVHYYNMFFFTLNILVRAPCSFFIKSYGKVGRSHEPLWTKITMIPVDCRWYFHFKHPPDCLEGLSAYYFSE